IVAAEVCRETFLLDDVPAPRLECEHGAAEHVRLERAHMYGDDEHERDFHVIEPQPLLHLIVGHRRAARYQVELRLKRDGTEAETHVPAERRRHEAVVERDIAAGLELRYGDAALERDLLRAERR